MTTFFDILTVACFAGLVIAFFQLTDRATKTLIHFVIAEIVLAVANQVGNAGGTILALVLVFAAAGYVFLVVRQ